MVKNEYDVSGHIIVPYTNAMRDMFLRKNKDAKYSLYKNDVLLEKRTNLSKSFVESNLLNKGYKLKKQTKVCYRPKKRVNGISIGVTKINKGSKVMELLISIHAPDMRSVIQNCDALVKYVEEITGEKIQSEAKLWTRQEMC